MLELEDGSIVKKSKGVNSDSLTKEDYENMFFNNKNIVAKKSNSIVDLAKGTVNIYKNKETFLNYNSYTKRNKIYNLDGLWENTKPIWYSNLKPINGALARKIIKFRTDNDTIKEFPLVTNYYSFFIV